MGAYTIDKAHSEAAFQVRHLITKVRGTFADLEGTFQFDDAKPDQSSVEFKVKTGSVDTNEKDRDGHLRSADFFDAEQHPEITFKSTKVTGNGKQLQVTGPLTIRGVTKEVALPVTFMGYAKDPWEISARGSKRKRR
jgi:polyisoprenoid-binding protein YceI